MENRRGDKVEEIEKYLKQLESSLPSSLEEYKSNFKIRAICERYFEKIVEAVFDLIFMIIKEKELRSPDSVKDSLRILSENKIISKELSEKLDDAKGMRNWIAHKYGEINDKLVFHAVTEELINDVKKFLEEINEIQKSN